MVDGAEVESPEFKWGKKRGIGGKKRDVQFYESFTYDGVEYTLYDCVYLYKENEPEPYIGKLIKIWENADKSKKVKVLWFFRPCEILNFLGDDQPPENELFLASGEGVGLANVNALEAIAGKCNVICTSNDSRNPQPSEEELQLADFTFYRLFDVANHKILDKIDEKIAGIEAKFIFNHVDSHKSSAVQKPGSGKNEVGETTVRSDKTTILAQQNKTEESKIARTSSIENAAKEDMKTSLVRSSSAHLEKSNSSANVGSHDRAKSNDKQEATFDNSSLTSRVKENTIKNPPLDRQKSLVEEKVSSGGGLLSGHKGKIDDRRGDALPNSMTSKSKSERSDGKGGKVLVNQVNAEERVKSNKASGELDNRPVKKAKLDSSMSVHDGKSKNSTLKSCGEFKGDNAKVDGQTIITKDKHNLKQISVKDSQGMVNGPSKKPHDDDKLNKAVGGQSTKASTTQMSNLKSKTSNQSFEVTRRPNDDRSKWFKELPWEDRMRAAHEQGTLVLLENVDPSYNSTEVEDIVWHAFKENCSARVVQRNAISSPYIGQAYVIFKTREAAEMVVMKLNEGCMMQSNGRPLIGRIPTSGFVGKQTTFFGHLTIDKLKHQMQREMREAVSTSHCSQPNTVEYDMAMEWCLLQERFDRSWKKLHEQQGEETRKLKARLKSK